MPNIFTEILHCKNSSSDKVYIVEVNEINKNYIVSATWGRRDAPRLSSQIKHECEDAFNAKHEAERLIEEKKRGKDKYIKAAKGLSIPGFKRTSTSAAELHTDAQHAQDAVLTTSVNAPQARRLKL